MATATRNGTTSDVFERVPPSNREAEIGVLGSVLLLPTVLDDVVANVGLRAIDFYDAANGKLYEHMAEMHNDGEKIDVTLLVGRLRKAGEFDEIGGAGYLAKVSEAVPNAAHAVYYAKLVRESAMQRRLIEAGTEMVHDGYDQQEPQQALERAERALSSIADHQPSRLATIREVLHASLDDIEARMNGEVVRGVKTGLADLDKLTGGLRNSEVTILAGRPGMGKSALALSIAAEIAGSEPVLVISMEMSQQELGDRLLCSWAKVNSHRLRNCTLTLDDRKSLTNAATRISDLKLYIDDSASRTASQIASVARRVKRQQKGLGALVIDYLQLIEPESHRDSRNDQIGKISRRMKVLSKELDIPVLCLSQLNRATEEGRNNIPTLKNLRESGSIEQDADNVWFVHREEYYRHGEAKEEVAGQAEIIVAKQRNGPTDTVKCAFVQQYAVFENLAPDRYSEFDDFNNGD